MGILIGLIIILIGLTTESILGIGIALVIGCPMIKKSFENGGLRVAIGIVVTIIGVGFWDDNLTLSLVIMFAGVAISGALSALFDLFDSARDRVSDAFSDDKKAYIVRSARLACFIIPVIWRVVNGSSLIDALIDQLLR